MINNVFLKQIEKYNPNNIEGIKNSMKEVLQDIILSGLGKSDFFKKAVFYGGTSLRIFRNLPRFSEDLDFTLIENDKEFELSKYFPFIKKELESLNLVFDIRQKEKRIETTVESCYFCFNLKRLFEISYPEISDKIIINESLNIKIEIEKNSFLGGVTEIKLLTYPSLVQVRTFNMETLFASKLIAVLNRKWKTRVKGRDFYDYLFYISESVSVNMIFLENGLRKFGYLNDNEKYDINRLKIDLKNRFEEIDFNNAINDVKPFISNEDRIIQSFNKDIFIASIDLIK